MSRDHNRVKNDPMPLENRKAARAPFHTEFEGNT